MVELMEMLSTLTYQDPLSTCVEIEVQSYKYVHVTDEIKFVILKITCK